MLDKRYIDAWNNQKIGLVLSGGGARGAYQAGAFIAIHELDIADKVTVVSGTSVGALNTVLFAMQSKYLCKKIWETIGFKNVLSPLNKEDRPTLKKIINSVPFEGLPDFSELAQMAGELVNPESTPFTTDGIRKLFDEYINLDRVRNSAADLFVCAYNTESEEPVYFNLKELSDENLINATLASSAIPYVFQPVSVDGVKYADGGVHIPSYKENNIDNTPTKPLADYKLDTVIIIHLDYIDEATDYSVFSKETAVIDIYPPKQAAVSRLNFSRQAMDELFEQGYHDALEALAPFVIDNIKKKPVVQRKVVKKGGSTD